MGGRDIYVCFNNGNNKWSEPENLSAVINTSEDEFAPFFSVAENALYFASRGHGGLGGSDIFRAVRLDDSYKNWSKPENIGPDINTEMDEKYFYFDESDESAFFARAKNETSYAIFRVERPRFIDPNPAVTLKGRVTGDKQPLAAAISLFTIPEDQLYAVTFSDESTGLYKIQLNSGHDYKLLGESEGYKDEELLVSLENRQEPYSYDLDLILSKELIEESPELQDEIAGINEQILKTTEETAPVVPAPQVTTSTGTNETVKMGVAEQEIVDQQSKANKLASLPQKSEVKEPAKDVAAVAGTTPIKPVADTGKPLEETADDGPGQAKSTTSTDKPAGESNATGTGEVQSSVPTAKPQEESAITRSELPKAGGPESKSSPGESKPSSGDASIKSSKKTEVVADNLVRFAFNSINFSSGTAVILDAIAEFLKRHENIRLEIGGFTDHLGDEMYNVELGKKRAQAVKNYLTGTGIAGNRIRIIGFGEKMPIIISNDRDQLLTNRRVEFNFTR
jgi:outer membrane protein OmpA-like peptidoglycan-associated protein